MAPPSADQNSSEKDWVNPLDLDRLTPTEKQALLELKERFLGESEVPNFFGEEVFLIHWLKARKFDVAKAEEMLRHHLKYRKAFGMDQPQYMSAGVVDKVMAEYYTRGPFGIGKHGHMVVYFPLGGIDPKGVMNSAKTSDILHTSLYWQEERRIACAELSKKLGFRVQQAIYILDLKGVGSKHLWMPGLEQFQQIARMLEQHSPELMYKVFVINAPSIFPALYRMVKPILDENTRNKISVFGNDGWREALQEEIPPDQIPVFYGGTALGPDGDLKCSHKIKYGGEVPAELYFEREDRLQRLLPRDACLTSASVPRGQQLLLYFTIQVPDSILYWYFESGSTQDVGFGIYRRDYPDQDLSVSPMVVPYLRRMTSLVPEWGYRTLPSGEYVVQFDNRYSWIYSKDIGYYVVMAEPHSPLFNALPLNHC